MLVHGSNTDRRLGAEHVVLQAVSLPLDDPAALTSEVCRRGFRYWSGLIGSGDLPDRSDVDPAGMPTLLPYTFLVDALDGGGGFRYRLIGTDIVAHTVGDNAGRTLSELAAQGSQRQLAALYAAVAGGRRPRYQRIAYRTRLGLRSWYETVVCPLGDGSAGGAVCRLIGWAEHFHQAVEAEIR